MYEYQNDKLQKKTANTQEKTPFQKETAADLGSNRLHSSVLPAQCMQSAERMNNLHTSLIEKMNRGKENKTGLPDRLKEGIESMSGFCLDDVRVHFNSEKPAQLQSYAYTQGLNIYVAPGQEKHLPHEAWHTVQQMQGRVKSNYKINHIDINDDNRLEREATVMGSRAANYIGQKTDPNDSLHSPFQTENVAQLARHWLNQSKKGHNYVIGINLMPSGGLKELLPITGRGYSSLSNKIAGHSSLIAGQLDADDRLILDQGRGFSPKGLLNSLRVGVYGFLGLKDPSVPGSYHPEDQAIVDDPKANQVVIYVSKNTYDLWVGSMTNAGINTEGGIYSYEPESGMQSLFGGHGTDNCTTVAFRNAFNICSSLIADAQKLNIDDIDQRSLKIFKDELRKMMWLIVGRNQKAETSKGSQGRAMIAFKAQTNYKNPTQENRSPARRRRSRGSKKTHAARRRGR